MELESSITLRRLAELLDVRRQILANLSFNWADEYTFLAGCCHLGFLLYQTIYDGVFKSMDFNVTFPFGWCHYPWCLNSFVLIFCSFSMSPHKYAESIFLGSTVGHRGLKTWMYWLWHRYTTMLIICPGGHLLYCNDNFPLAKNRKEEIQKYFP